MAQHHSQSLTRIMRYAFVLAIIWTGIVVASASWALYSQNQHTLDTARIEAQASFDKDLVYLRWASMHGGVYVPVTETTQPNPYLDVPHRDITTTDGQQLTLINPAYMTRQVHELAQEQYGAQGHITSLNPIRPENAADEWEADVLRAFESGTTEVSSVEMFNGEQHMRYMQAMVVEQSCMACHEYQGYEIGDIRGGISVSVPMQPFWDAQQPIQRNIMLGHGMLWVVGILGLGFSTARFIVSENREYAAFQRITQNENRYHQMFHENQAIKLVIDPETGRILEANQAAVDYYGYTARKLVSMRIQDINTKPDDEVCAEMKRITSHQRSFFQFQHRLANGDIRDVDVFSSPVDTPDGQVLYSIIVDVTAQREAENRREKLVDQLRFLNRTMPELLTLPDEDSIYNYMGEKLYELLDGDAIVTINYNTPEEEKMTVQGVYGLDETQFGKLMTIMGFSLVGASFNTDPYIQPLFESGTFQLMEGGLMALAERVLPRPVIRQIVRFFNLGDIYVIGLQKDGTLYAGIQLYMRGDAKVAHPDLIEAFIHQASTVIQRLQAVKSLQESEMRYRSLFEQSNDAVFILDLEGAHQHVNQRAADMLGYESATEIVGLTYRDIIVPSQQTQSRRVIERLLDGERVPPYERTFRRKDGTSIFGEINADLVRDGNGNPLHVQSVVRDITKRKADEAALRRSEARLRALLSAIPDMMFRNHRDGTYLDYYAPNYDALLLNPADFLGKKTQDVMPPALAEQHETHITLALDTGEQQQYRYDLDFGDETRTFEARMVVAGDDEVLSIVRDITDLKQMQKREFELTLERERIQILTTFIQNATHEFRTPLSTIGTSVYLMTRSDDPERRQQKAAQVQEEIERITTLVDSLVFMAKLEGNAFEAHQPLDLSALLQSICQTAQARNTNGPDIRCEIVTPLPHIMGNVEGLEHALHELVDNALRHTAPEGNVTIATGATDDIVWCEIRDTGSGIPEDALPHIFETFWREDTAHTTPGLGLGLSIANTIIAQHHGHIIVRSEVGQGATFRVELPLFDDKSDDLQTEADVVR